MGALADRRAKRSAEAKAAADLEWWHDRDRWFGHLRHNLVQIGGSTLFGFQSQGLLSNIEAALCVRPDSSRPFDVSPCRVWIHVERIVVTPIKQQEPVIVDWWFEDCSQIVVDDAGRSVLFETGRDHRAGSLMLRGPEELGWLAGIALNCYLEGPVEAVKKLDIQHAAHLRKKP